MKRLLLSVLVALILISCGEKMTVEKINELESKVFAKGVEVSEDNVVGLVDAYLLFAKQNPDDAQSPDFLFKALDVAVGTNIEGPQKCIVIADMLIEAYPEFEMTPMAMFIKGFVYENMMKDYAKALETYHHFLESYHDSPMAADVRATINNMGIPLEELVKTFEQ